ncbi:hypothetical protein [Maribacter sp. 2307ULW6-5]|uniref:FEKKY domain-containing protein n=1 Tax=Maribacter sp. 2307ULW6-5 TaxID=3386275 RepID=UPI0039BC2BE8
MKYLIFSLLFCLPCTGAFATDGEITAQVVFENLTQRDLRSGTFTIIGANTSIEVNDANPFNITLPGKGKYEFLFSSEHFVALLSYPKKITPKNNLIKIQLLAKYNSNKLTVAAQNGYIENRIADGNLNFVLHGMDATVPREYLELKRKYGVGLVKENCAIDPVSMKAAKEHNKRLSQYLDQKYGSTWSEGLTEKPFGL